MERLEVYFKLVEDKRHQSYVKYKMGDILFIIVCGLLCGNKDLEAIIEFAEEREEFLRGYLRLEKPPCLMTLTNILKKVNPEQLELCLNGIFRNVLKQQEKTPRQIIIDGKTICSTRTMKDYEKPLHIVTALLADYSISLGQITVDSKSNEIPAVKELLDLIDSKGSVVTMDAMHCQKDTIEKIIEKKADYVVQLKGNQGTFYEDVYAMFDDKYMDENDPDSEYEIFETIEKSHGRIEKRTCYVLNDIAYFTDYLAEWEGLKKIFAVKRVVQQGGTTTEEISCYLSSKNTSAENLLSYSRKHWQIESFHWMLDVHFGEDDCRVRDRNAQLCLNITRKFAISMLKKYIVNHLVKRTALSSNMRKCLLNQDYLASVLNYYCAC